MTEKYHSLYIHIIFSLAPFIFYSLLLHFSSHDDVLTWVVFILTLFGVWRASSVQFSSVALSRPTLCDPMNRRMSGLPVHYQLLEFTQNSCPLSGWCHPAISSSTILFFSWPQSFPASGSFQMSQLFASGGQSIGVSASTSVLPMNI